MLCQRNIKRNNQIIFIKVFLNERKNSVIMCFNCKWATLSITFLRIMYMHVVRGGQKWHFVTTRISKPLICSFFFEKRFNFVLYQRKAKFPCNFFFCISFLMVRPQRISENKTMSIDFQFIFHLHPMSQIESIFLFFSFHFIRRNKPKPLLLAYKIRLYSIELSVCIYFSFFSLALSLFSSSSVLSHKQCALDVVSILLQVIV